MYVLSFRMCITASAQAGRRGSACLLAFPANTALCKLFKQCCYVGKRQQHQREHQQTIEQLLFGISSAQSLGELFSDWAAV